MGPTLTVAARAHDSFIDAGFQSRAAWPRKAVQAVGGETEVGPSTFLESLHEVVEEPS
jgi:hypothetical protein